MFDSILKFRLPQLLILKNLVLEISIDKNDYNFLRFLWFENVFSDAPKIVSYQFKRVVFGVNSSPFFKQANLIKTSFFICKKLKLRFLKYLYQLPKKRIIHPELQILINKNKLKTIANFRGSLESKHWQFFWF